MRKSIILIICFLSYSALDSQNAADISNLIKQLSSNYTVDIAYATDLIEKAEGVAIESFDPKESLDNNLKTLFGTSSIAYYKVEDNKVLLRLHPLESNDLEKKIKVSGLIIDELSGQPLPYASVYVEGTTSGVITDEHGYFEWEHLPEGTPSITISYLGYESKSIDPKKCNPDAPIYLAVSSTVIEEVMIVIQPEAMSHGSYGKLNVNSNRFMSVSAVDVYGSDFLRSLQSLAGVNAMLDRGGEIRLRGSAPEETLIIIDGIKLFNVDHYYGIFSAINSAYVDQFTLYKNHVPVQHESRLGGMVDIQSIDNIDDNETQLEIDLLKATVSSQLKLSDKIAVNIGGRINHTDPSSTPLSSQVENIDFENALSDDGAERRSQLVEATPTFAFKDINASIHITPSDQWKFRLNGIYTEDEFLNRYTNSINLLRANGNATFLEKFDATENWINSGFSALASYVPAEGHQVNFHLSSSYTDTDINTLVSIERERILENKTLFDYDQIVDNRISNSLTKVEYVGIEGTYGVELSSSAYEVMFEENDRNRLNREQSFLEYSAYGSRSIPLTSKSDLTLGARLTYNDELRTTNFNPSLYIRHRLSESIALKASAARLNQNLRNISFENRLGQFRNLYILSDLEEIPIGSSYLWMTGMIADKGNWLSLIHI